MENQNNVVNLHNWVKSNDIFNLKGLDHAHKLKKVAESLDAPMISLEQYQAEVEALKLIPLNQSERA